MESKKQTEVSGGIDFHEILIEIINRKFLVIGIIVLGVLVSFLYTKFFAKQKYVACSKMLITKTTADDTQLNTGDFSVSSYLIRDYQEIILDKVVLSRVAAEAGVDYSVGQLKKSINIENPSNSRVLEIYVSAETPEAAQKIANKVCDVSKEEIFEILNQDTINIISKADKPTAPSGSNMMQNLIYGLFGGAIIAVVLIGFICVFDDTLTGKDDVRKYLGLEVLSVIPYVKPKENSDKKTTRGK